MKQVNQLIIIEADTSLTPLMTQHSAFLESISASPVCVLTSAIEHLPAEDFPELILVHQNLITTGQLDQFVYIHSLFPHATIIIISHVQDEELCLLALENGAADSISFKEFTPSYLRKLVILSGRRRNIQKELRDSKQQLLACIQNPYNVAVQWFNSKGEVLFWNKASERIFEWTAEEALGKNIDDLIITSDNKHFWSTKINHICNHRGDNLVNEWSFFYRDGREGCCISTVFSIPSFYGELWVVCMDVEITDRKKMEQTLQKSEERYRTLFNEASDAIFINDEDCNFIDVNQKGCELLNLPREQLLQMKITDLYTKEELSKNPLMIEELLSGVHTFLEREMITADGTTIPVEVTGQRFQDGQFMAIVRNTSERKKVEEALRKSEYKYRSLIEHQADAITIFDTEGNILEANTSATQLLQYTREEFLTMKVYHVLAYEEAKINPIKYDALMQGLATIKQRKMRRKDGSIVETEVHTKQLWDGHFLSSVRDLTERIEVQHKLQKEIELSDAIINSLPGLFYLYQKEDNYSRWNKQLEIISGYTAAEIQSMALLAFVEERDRPRVECAMKKVFEKGESAIEATFITKEGKKIPFYFTGRLINHAGKSTFLGTGMDLSAMKNLEKQLAEQKIAEQKKVMQAMIDASEKEKSKLGLELHDNINQILSVVRMYLAILNTNQVLEGITLEQTIQLVNTAIEEIRNLSHSLAASYQFDAGLTEALEDMIEKIKLTRDFSIELVTAPDLNDFTNTNQKLAVYRIVQEQLNNIMKYSKATMVVVRIDLTEEELFLAITDNGRGFTPATTPKGLGLNNITNRAESLDGSVLIEASPGNGCQLYVRIPLAARRNIVKPLTDSLRRDESTVET